MPDGLDGAGRRPETAKTYADVITGAGTVFWNGPMGAFELAPFAAGTKAVAEAVAAAAARRSSAAATAPPRSRLFGLEDEVTHLSTGGGASLELIEGKTLPGVEVLS